MSWKEKIGCFWCWRNGSCLTTIMTTVVAVVLLLLLWCCCCCWGVVVVAASNEKKKSIWLITYLIQLISKYHSIFDMFVKVHSLHRSPMTWYLDQLQVFLVSNMQYAIKNNPFSMTYTLISQYQTSYNRTPIISKFDKYTHFSGYKVGILNTQTKKCFSLKSFINTFVKGSSKNNVTQ